MFRSVRIRKTHLHSPLEEAEDLLEKETSRPTNRVVRRGIPEELKLCGEIDTLTRNSPEIFLHLPIFHVELLSIGCFSITLNLPIYILNIMYLPVVINIWISSCGRKCTTKLNFKKYVKIAHNYNFITKQQCSICDGPKCPKNIIFSQWKTAQNKELLIFLRNCFTHINSKQRDTSRFKFRLGVKKSVSPSS